MKKQLIKLGYTNPELRHHLTPILDAISGSPKIASNFPYERGAALNFKKISGFPEFPISNIRQVSSAKFHVDLVEIFSFGVRNAGIITNINCQGLEKGLRNLESLIQRNYVDLNLDSFFIMIQSINPVRDIQTLRGAPKSIPVQGLLLAQANVIDRNGRIFDELRANEITLKGLPFTADFIPNRDGSNAIVDYSDM